MFLLDRCRCNVHEISERLFVAKASKIFNRVQKKGKVLKSSVFLVNILCLVTMVTGIYTIQSLVIINRGISFLFRRNLCVGILYKLLPTNSDK